MYFVEEGEAVVRIKAEEDGQEVELTRYTQGGYFGELALVTKQPRAASVYAATSIKVRRYHMPPRRSQLQILIGLNLIRLFVLQLR